MITRSYQAVFKRTPTLPELSYWQADVRAKRHTYRELVGYHQQWQQKHGNDPGPPPSGAQMVLRVAAPDAGPGVTRITSASFDLIGPSFGRSAVAHQVAARRSLTWPQLTNSVLWNFCIHFDGNTAGRGFP